MKLNPAAKSDRLKVYVKTREGSEVTLNAYLSPEFDDEGFLRVMGQEKSLCIHKSNVSHFTWEFIEGVDNPSAQIQPLPVSINDVP